MAEIKARVLLEVTIEGNKYQPDDVVSLDEAQLYDYRGMVDPHPDAVRHAESIARSKRMNDPRGGNSSSAVIV